MHTLAVEIRDISVHRPSMLCSSVAIWLNNYSHYSRTPVE